MKTAPALAALVPDSGKAVTPVVPEGSYGAPTANTVPSGDNATLAPKA